MLKLTHFSKKPIIDFGTCKINKPVVRELVIDNCNAYDVDVIVERFPFKKNFAISKVRSFFYQFCENDLKTVSKKTLCGSHDIVFYLLVIKLTCLIH